jgi:hypothetical protein
MKVSRLREAFLVAAMAGMAACSNDRVAAPTDAQLSLIPVLNDGTYYDPKPGMVKVCTFFEPGTFSTVLNSGPAGTTILSTETLAPGDCSITWMDNGVVGDFSVTVTQTGPAGFDLKRLAMISVSDDIFANFEDPDGCGGNLPIPAGHTAELTGGDGVVFFFKACPPSPPPPGDCDGLTPGYWKNWKNHYSYDQFAELIDNTSFPDLSNTEATNILKANNPALARLFKFVLANELTLALTNLENLPNPSGGNLTETCAVNGGSQLGASLVIALDMLENPGNYTEQEILDMGSILDAIANLNGG